MAKPRITKIRSNDGPLTDQLPTADATLTLKGRAAPGETVRVFDGSTLLGVAKVNKKGKWTFAPEVLTDGVHSFKIQTKSKASKAKAVTVDTVTEVPGIDLSANSDSGRSASDNVTSDATPTLGGTAEAGATVTIREGGTVLGTTVADSAGTWSLTLAQPLADGSHGLTATATDRAGNVSGPSLTLALEIDTTAPETPTRPDLDSASDSGLSTTDDVTNDATPTLTGVADGGATVTIRDGANVLGTVVAGPSGDWTFTVATPLTDGSHSLTATVSDEAGNAAQSPALTIVVDTEAPPVPSTPDLVAASDSGFSATDDVTGDETPTFRGTAPPGTTVRIYADAVEIGSAVADADGNWTITTSNLPDGTYSISARAYDSAGNASVASAIRDVTIDTSAPATPSTPDLDTASDYGSSSTDNVTGDDTPTFIGSAEVGALVRILADGTEIGSGVADMSGNWSITSGSLASGAYSITAIATDAAGNQSAASGILALTISGIGQPDPPSTPDLAAGSDSGASSTDDVTSSTTPTFVGTAAPGAVVTLYSAAVEIGSATADAEGNWVIVTTSLSAGTHAVTAIATVGGVSSTASGAVSVVIDTMAPAAPSAPDLLPDSDSGTASDDDLSNDDTPTFGGTAEAGATVTLLADGSAVGSAVADGNGDWRITTSSLADGDWSITATATDLAGNTSAASPALTVTIDTVEAAPAALDLASGSDSGTSASDDITSDSTPTISGTAGAGATITLYAGAVEVGSAVADGSGNWSVTASTLADGVHDITATARDGAGNDSDASDTLAVTIDTATTTPAITGFADTGTLGDGRTSADIQTLAGTAEGEATVEFFDGAVSLGTTTADAAGLWTFETPSLALGSHTLTAIATDPAGNVSAVSGSVTFIVEAETFYALDYLQSSQGFVIAGVDDDDASGNDVASAGDINGDGIDDFLVGAFQAPDGGRAYVIFGGTSGLDLDAGGRQSIALADLGPDQGFIIEGAGASAFLGRSMAGAGDVNGDGYDDLIVAALLAPTGLYSGETYVLFGSATGFGPENGSGQNVVDLAMLAPEDGFVIRGASADDMAGTRVAAGGDVNGDGLDDIVIGAPGHDTGGGDAGAAYVVYGSAGGFGAEEGGRMVLDLADLTADTGTVIRGGSGGDAAGTSVGLAGDVNGDGFADIIVGAPEGDDADANAGQAYVVFGGAGLGAAIDPGTLGATRGFVILGDTGGSVTDGDRAGTTVAGAGDVNGDGYDDLLVGAPLGSEAGNDAGSAYVVFGTAGGFGTTDIVTGRQVIDLGALTAAQGFVIQGEAPQDSAGVGLGAAGDFNGDGYADIFVSASGNDAAGGETGAVYLIYGSAAGFGSAVGIRQVIDLASLSPDQGFIIEGENDGDRLMSVSAGGDVNGDGFADIIVGASQDDSADPSDADAYVIFGGPSGGAGTPVTAMGTTDADTLIGGAADDALSGGGGADVVRGGAGNDRVAVSDLGFLRVDGGNGSDTLALAGSGLTLDLTDRGQAARLDAIVTGYGDIDAGTAAAVEGFEIIDLGDAGNTLVLDQRAVFNETPWNADGQHVLVVTGGPTDVVRLAEADWENAGTIVDGATTYLRYVQGDAEAWIESGVGVGFVYDLAKLTSNAGATMVLVGSSGSATGTSIASAGDINGDGYGDVVIGAPFLHGGRAYVVFGSADGPGVVSGDGTLIDLASLTADLGFVIAGSNRLGETVAAAGDLNGDGIDDLVVTGHDGTAYVIFGSQSGFGAAVDIGGVEQSVIDVADLDPAEGFVTVGHAGSAAGDVNGDGFADLIVGDYQAGPDGRGAAYVIYGSADGFGSLDGNGRALVDVGALSAVEGFVVLGVTDNSSTGFDVSGIGDFNGDGYADVVIGATRESGGGQAFVIFGSASGIGSLDANGRSVVDLSTLADVEGIIIRGDASGDRFGVSVSGGGDVNGDGLDDLIVGAQRNGNGGEYAGEAYVIFGSAAIVGSADGDGRQVIDVSELTADLGFVIRGVEAEDFTGSTVSAAGDINGDGYADILIAAVDIGADFEDKGAAYVVFGSANGFGVTDQAGRQVVDLGDLDPSEGFAIGTSARFVDQLGTSVSAAGDIDGDGYDDLLVGAPTAQLGGSGAGWIIYGGPFGGTIATAGSAAGEVLVGGSGDDVIFGGGGADSIRGGAGNDAVHVADADFVKVDGGSGTDTLVLSGAGIALDLTDAPTAERLEGVEQIDLGRSGNTVVVDQRAVLTETAATSGGTHVLAIGGGVLDTVVLTEIQWTLAGTVADGATTYDRYVFGNAELRIGQGVTVTLPASIDSGALTASQGFLILGAEAADQIGWSVSAVGDVNGDGLADVIVGAPYGNDGAGTTGEAYVIFGSTGGFGSRTFSGGQALDVATLDPMDGFAIVSSGGGFSRLGWSVSGAGDVNGDGYDDLILGETGYDSGTGSAYVIFGTDSGFGTLSDGRRVVDVDTLEAESGFVIVGASGGDLTGYGVAAAGDLNHDGFADLLVSAPDADNSVEANGGVVYVVFGSSSGFGTLDGGGRAVIDLATIASSAGYLIKGDAAADHAGASVAGAGDVNGDGHDDLIIGAASGDDGGLNAGEAYVVFGSASAPTAVDGSGRAFIDLTTLAPGAGFVIRGDAAHDAAGYAVSGAGDLNGDGIGDLVIGAPYGDDAGTAAGEAYVVFGSSSGFGTVDGSGRAVIDLSDAASGLDPAAGFVIRGGAGSDLAGFSVARAGDFNGDGTDDLVVTAALAAGTGTDAGAAYVLFGTASGFGTVDSTGRAVVDLSALSSAEGLSILGGGDGDRFGQSASGAGDLNGDGYDDVIIGAPGDDGAGSDAGAATIVFGGSGGMSTASRMSSGGAAAETIVGGAGDDILSGGGGMDVIRGGAGDDLITVGDAFAAVHGGSGDDTLVLAGIGTFAFNLGTLNDVSGIETLDLSNHPVDEVLLDAADVVAFSDTANTAFTGADSHNSLVIRGDAGDVVHFDPSGAEAGLGYTWVLAGANLNLDGSGGGEFDVWNAVQSSKIVASVAIDADMAVLFGP